MRTKKLIALLLVVVMAAGIALTGCGAGKNADDTKGATSTTESTKPDGKAEVTINLGTEPVQMNSILTTDVVSMNVMRHVSEGLTKLDPNNKPIAAIATSWDISPDGLKYTFHLRTDSKWTDGTAVTAKDFEFAWKTILKKDTAAEYAGILYCIKGGQEYNLGTGKVEDVGIKSVDDKTLEVTLARPTPFFLDLCAFGVYLPVNEAFYKKNIQGDKNTNGTEANLLMYNGPFKMTSWAHEDKIVLEKNPDYYDAAKTKLDKITMLMVKDTNTGYNMFVAGEADMVGLKGSDQVKKAESDGFKPSKYSDGATAYFEFNLKDPIMKNVNIRKALTYAVDRKSLVTKIFKNSSSPALSFTNPEIKGLKDTFKSEVGDLIKDNNSNEAKALLKKGMEELGLKTMPKISLVTEDTDVAKRDAAAYQEYWKKNLGIDVEILSMPFKSRINRLQTNDFQVAVSLWGPDYNDPMTFLDMFETGNGNNHTSFSDKSYDELLGKIRIEVDPAKRFDYLKQTEVKLMDALPIGPLYFRIRDYVVKPNLKGVIRTAFQDINLNEAYLEK